LDMMIAVLLCFYVSTAFSTAPAPVTPLPGPWLMALEWGNKDNQHCPNLETTGIPDLISADGDTGFAIDTNNDTYGRKRSVNGIEAAADCVFLNGYGLNSFLTFIVPKANYSLGVSYNETTVTITDYAQFGCLGPVSDRAVRPLNICLEDGSENGVNYTRWFQFFTQEPPGFTPISDNGPTYSYTLAWYLPEAPTPCSYAPVQKTTYINNQQCHEIYANLYINGYCGSSTTFTGIYCNNSDCTQGCVNFGSQLTDQCLSDFTAYGTADGAIVDPVTNIFVVCSAFSTTVSFIIFATLLFLSFM